MAWRRMAVHLAPLSEAILEHAALAYQLTYQKSHLLSRPHLLQMHSIVLKYLHSPSMSPRTHGTARQVPTKTPLSRIMMRQFVFT